MKLSRYCACGSTLTGRASPDHAARVLNDIFDKVHSEPGCAPATPEQARAARRRAERIANAPPANTFEPPF